MSEAKLAEVKFSCGRCYLSVVGFTLAVEGDLCRDDQIEERQWTKSQLENIAEKINELGGLDQ